jgi:hypothetical protein
MDKSGYDERVLGGLDDLPREGTLERPLDYTLNPRFKFCFLGLWSVSIKRYVPILR